MQNHNNPSKADFKNPTVEEIIKWSAQARENLTKTPCLPRHDHILPFANGFVQADYPGFEGVYRSLRVYWCRHCDKLFDMQGNLIVESMDYGTGNESVGEHESGN